MRMPWTKARASAPTIHFASRGRASTSSISARTASLRISSNAWDSSQAFTIGYDGPCRMAADTNTLASRTARIVPRRAAGVSPLSPRRQQAVPLRRPKAPTWKSMPRAVPGSSGCSAPTPPDVTCPAPRRPAPRWRQRVGQPRSCRIEVCSARYRSGPALGARPAGRLAAGQPRSSPCLSGYLDSRSAATRCHRNVLTEPQKAGPRSSRFPTLATPLVLDGGGRDVADTALGFVRRFLASDGRGACPRPQPFHDADAANRHRPS